MNRCDTCKFYNLCQYADNYNFCEDCVDGDFCSIRSFESCMAGYDIECNNGFQDKYNFIE